MATGQKEHDQAICWDQWQPSPKWDLGAEPSTMDLIGPQMSQAKIRVIYNQVYKLQKLPGRSPHDEETEERIHQEILDSIKEHLWHRWVPTQVEEELKQSPTSTSKTDTHAEFQARTHATYNHYKNMWQDSCKKALAVARDAHWWALAAMIILEEIIEWLSHSVSCRWSGSCRHRSWSAGHPLQAPWTEPCYGGPVRWAKLPSPARMRWRVTFEELSSESSPERDMAVKELLPSTSTTEDMSDWSQPAEGDLRCPSSLDPLLEDFLGGEMPLLGVEVGDGFQWSSMPKSSFKNSFEWVMWWANLVNTLTWWPELAMVSGERDMEEFARKVWASFKMPKRRSCVQGTPNDYSAPQTPQVLEHDQFLPISTSHLMGRIIACDSHRRPWYMPKPCNTGLRRTSHHIWVNPTN